MLGYVCKYTPVEALTAVGAEVVRVEPAAANFNQADTLMHPNVCSFAKSVLEDMAAKQYEGIVLTTCCDSIRRLYDTLAARYPDKFFYLLDVPRVVNDFSARLYGKRILALLRAYRDFRGAPLPDETLEALAEDEVKKAIAASHLRRAPRGKNELRIGLIGARYAAGVRALLEEEGVEPVFDLTCVGMARKFPRCGERAQAAEREVISGATRQEIADASTQEIFTPSAQAAAASAVQTSRRAANQAAGDRIPERGDTADFLTLYARDLLEQIPCMRMIDAVNRENYVEGMESELDGLIYHTVKFCDSYSYEYARLHKEGKLPILKVETDLTKQCEGQIRTRIEAFLESLRIAKGETYDGENGDSAPSGRRRIGWPRGQLREGKMQAEEIRIMGVDSGSTSTNAVIMNGKKEILASAIVRTGAKSGESAERVLEEVLRQSGLRREQLSLIVSTGYGRVSIPYADTNVTEISCHGKGARYFNPRVRTILDIGGQDSKAISLNEAGEVADFVMNDKCAAGTGRFLEAMARTLELDIAELGPVSLRSTQEVEISSMCTVFAESEVISLIAQNKEKADIAHGVHKAIAGKAFSLLKRVGLQPEFMMTGGVARNPGVVKAVEEKIGAPLFICPQPDIVGAVGAALFGLESLEK